MKPVLIITLYGGIIFGYVEQDAKLATKMRVAKSRLFFNSELKEFLSIAQNGAPKEVKISSPADALLHGVIAMKEVTWKL